MNQFAAKVRHGNPDALRKFIMTTRAAPSREQAWKKLRLSEGVFYRLLRDVRDAGHTV
jgi:hypothetical protein